MTYREFVIPNCTTTDVILSEAHPKGDPEDWIEILNTGATACRLGDFEIYNDAVKDACVVDNSTGLATNSVRCAQKLKFGDRDVLQPMVYTVFCKGVHRDGVTQQSGTIYN